MVHIADIGRSKRQVHPIARLGGARTLAAVVPMLKEDELIGAIAHLSPGGSAVHRQADRAGQRTSPARPSSRSRTSACSTSCAPAPTIWRNRSTNCARSARSARRSTRRSTSKRCSTPSCSGGAALGHRRRRDLRFRRGAAGIPAPRHLRHERRVDRRDHRPPHRHRRRRHRAGRDAAQAVPDRRPAQKSRSTRQRDHPARRLPRAADRPAAAARPDRRRAGGAPQGAGRVPASTPSTCCRPSPPSRCWRSRTRACSARSARRASSSRSRASTSRSSSPT